MITFEMHSSASLMTDLYDISVNKSANSHLRLHFLPTETLLNELIDFIQQNKPFPFKKLSLKINSNFLQNELFLKSLADLNETNGFILELDISDDNTQALEKLLITNLVPLAHYPIQITGQHFAEFQAMLIANIQKKYATKPIEQARPSKKRNLPNDHPLNKPLKLKTLIANNAFKRSDISHYLSMEVQHLEAVEEQVTVNQVIEEQVDVSVDTIQQYAGPLVSWNDFCSNARYRDLIESTIASPELVNKLLSVLNHELFANLPHAIKYISPEGATHLAQNLPQFLSLNLDNLPQGFMLKQTEEGEYVLDYSLHAINEQSNVFTPSAFNNNIRLEPIYNIELNENALKAWINNPVLFEKISPNPYKTPAPLINLWIYYGDTGVCTFFHELEETTRAQPSLLPFLVDHYFAYFPQWEHFKDPSFFATLQQVSHFSKAKLACFKKFLINTGSSRHDLNKTCEAFESFWNQYTLLCQIANINLSRINEADWLSPEGGDPVVYMERLLFILKNARSLDDQLHGLGTYLGKHPFCLDNYGAYYAARFEGFKSVSSEMAFHYDPEQQNQRPFNKNFYLHRIKFDDLFEQWRSIYKADHVQYSGSYNSDFYLIDPTGLPTPFHDNDLREKPKKLCSLKPFEAPYQIYRRDKMSNFYPWISTYSELLNNEEIKTAALRTLALRTTGMTVSDFSQQFFDFRLGHNWHSYHARCEKNPAKNEIHIQFDNASQQIIYTLLSPKGEILTDTVDFTRLKGFDAKKHLPLTVDKLKDDFLLRDSFLGTLIKRGHAEYDEEFTDFRNCLIAMVLLLTDERTTTSVDIERLYRSVTNVTDNRVSISYSHALVEVFESLYRLSKRDIHLSEEEAKTLFAAFALEEHSIFDRAKVYYVQKLIQQLEQNPFATLKLLNAHSKKIVPRAGSNFELVSLQPIAFALDTAAFFAEDELVADFYRDDLLLFSELINNKYSYYMRFEESFNLSEDDQIKYLSEAKRRLVAPETVQTVRDYLSQAARLEKPNNLHYAIETLLQAKKPFTFDKFISVCSEITALETFNILAVNQCLTHHGFILQAQAPSIVIKDRRNLRSLLIELISQLQSFESPVHSLLGTLSLKHKSLEHLEALFQELWSKHGVSLSVSKQTLFKKTLHDWKVLTIQELFTQNDPTALFATLGQSIVNLNDFETCDSIDKLQLLAGQAKRLASLFEQISHNPYVKEKAASLRELFADFDFSRVNYDVLYAVLSFLSTMPQRNYVSLLVLFFEKSGKIVSDRALLDVLNDLTALDKKGFPSDYLAAFTTIRLNNKNKEEQLAFLLHQISVVFEKDNKDPVLKLSLTHPDLSLTQRSQLLSLSVQVNNKDKLTAFFTHLIETKQLDAFLNNLENPTEILDILSLGHAQNRNNIDYVAFKALLSQLSKEELDALHLFYKKTPLGGECLFNELKKGKALDFSEFVDAFQKSPFGTRDVNEQFSCEELERVINDFDDMLNNSTYPYEYRKKLMESFLLVNESGYKLPLYNNKPANQLTNEEIQANFAALKANKHPHLSPFRRRLLALPLIREAMYRGTSEFPYPAQIIPLLDGMMHEGDLISNIDPGQGKSLIDLMKAALLWLDSDRVDLITSSLEDSKRDLQNYGNFLNLLGIPHSENPINASSPFSDFQPKGINLSTAPQLFLFLSRAKFLGIQLEAPSDSVSLVINESDFLTLDDLTIFRLAIADNECPQPGEKWIYRAITEFVGCAEFLQNDKITCAEMIDNLKDYILTKGKALKKPAREFSDEKYLSWIVSALMGKYVLIEDTHYVIAEGYKTKLINKALVPSKVIEILMANGKASTDSTYGKGLEQLLYDYFNSVNGNEDFVLSPETKTVFATIAKNFINKYRAKKGFIWGSSGTVGSLSEIQAQNRDYGFEFSKIASHQKDQIIYHEACIEENEEAQFKKLIQQLIEKPNANTYPQLVFCKDIETAKRFYAKLAAYFVEHNNDFPHQCYLGSGEEEEYIRKAALPGMITVTTSAIGRNTNILYQRDRGMHVWHTCVDSFRKMIQKSRRTGRQGSPGEVHFVFNQHEQQGMSIEEIQRKLAEKASAERQYNDELYSILGYFLHHIEDLPDDHFKQGKRLFFTDCWSNFSTISERKFSDSWQEENRDKETILKTLLDDFNQLIAKELVSEVNPLTKEDISAALTAKTPEKKRYNPYTKKVMISDCISPTVLAYHCLHFQGKETIDKSAIKNELKQLFATLHKDNFTDLNEKYIHYLAATSASQEEIVTVHKEFIEEYLTENRKKPSLINRWLGHQRQLNHIVTNQHYLLQFHAFTHLAHEPIVDLELMKKTVNALINNYLQSAWFINSERKQWAIALKNGIKSAETLEAIMGLLIATQIETTKNDLASNEKRLKPLHFFKKSRYIDTLNQSLSLVSSISGNTNVNGLIKPLAELLHNQPLNEFSFEDFKDDVLEHCKDERMAAVIVSSLENAFSIKEKKEPEGMLGRHSLFKPTASVATRNEEEQPHGELQPCV